MNESGSVRCVVFFLRHSGVMENEVREVRSLVARYTVSGVGVNSAPE